MRAENKSAAWAWLVGGAVGLGWLAAAHFGATAATRVRAADSRSDRAPYEFVAASNTRRVEQNGKKWMDAALEAADQKDWIVAGEALHHAWQDPSTRDEAAKGLHQLHTNAAFKVPVDEAAVGAVQDVLGEKFARYETKRFVVLSDVDRKWTQAKAALLERTCHQFYRAMDRMHYPAHPPAQKLLCILFENHADYRVFAAREDGVEAEWVAGYYASLSNRIVFYDDTTGPGFAEANESLAQTEENLAKARQEMHEARSRRDHELADAYERATEEIQEHVAEHRELLDEAASRSSISKTIHEAVHLIAFNSGLQSRASRYPFWFTEGLAVSFETSDPVGSFGPGDENTMLDAEFAELRDAGSLIPLDEFVSLTHVGHGHTPDLMYAQAYGLFVYLHRYAREEVGAFCAAVQAEPAGPLAPYRLTALFESHFGASLKVEQRWLADRPLPRPRKSPVARIGERSVDE